MAAEGYGMGDQSARRRSIDQEGRRKSMEAVNLSPGRANAPFSPRPQKSSGSDRAALLKAFALPALGVAMLLGVLGVATVQSARSAHARPLPAGLEGARRALAETAVKLGVVNAGAMPRARVLRDNRELLSGWTDGGRATWYGGPGGPGPDGMDISKGSCGFGNKVFENEYIAAVNTNGGYDWGLTDKCDVCFEVMCEDGDTRGMPHSREAPDGGCLESGVRAIVVRITDSCPCHHPNTGNLKWCCGDKMHFDLSYVAFDAIAKRDKGVVDLKWREVSCSRQGEISYYDDGGTSMHGGGGNGDQVVTAMDGEMHAWGEPPPPPQEWEG